MKDIFKQIPQTMYKPLTPKTKIQKLMTDIGGGCYMGESSKGLPPLRSPKLSKTSQEKQDGIQKNLYEANKWWNYCGFQLHWNKLEWVNPKSLIKREKTYSVSSKSST